MADGTPPDGMALAAVLSEALTGSGLTQSAAARLVGISLRGFKNLLTGRDSRGLPVRGRPFTVARVALTLGVTADQLRAVGRDDAAEKWEVLRGTPGSDPEVWLRGVRNAFDSEADFMHYVLSVVNKAPTGGERVEST